MNTPTIIIPFKWSLIKPDAIFRLIINCLHLKRLGVRKIVVADSTKFRFVVTLVARLLKVVIHDVPCEDYYSPAQTKNFAANKCDSERYILFVDVDVLLNAETLKVITSEMADGIQFSWYPVIFLKPDYGFRKMLSVGIFNGEWPRADSILQIGYSTGIQLFKLDFFKSLEGYGEHFSGYGCEDIEMIHRATGVLRTRPAFMADSPYFNDVRSYDPQRLSGFRKFNFEAKVDFRRDAMPMHFWHVRKNKSGYMKSRKKNDELLIKSMVLFDEKLVVQNVGQQQ